MRVNSKCAHQVRPPPSIKQSTGVYWIPLYEILHARGLEVYLVNAAHQESPRAQERRAREPVAAEAPHLRPPPQLLSPARRDSRRPDLL